VRAWAIIHKPRSAGPPPTPQRLHQPMVAAAPGSSPLPSQHLRHRIRQVIRQPPLCVALFDVDQRMRKRRRRRPRHCLKSSNRSAPWGGCSVNLSRITKKTTQRERESESPGALTERHGQRHAQRFRDVNVSERGWIADHRVDGEWTAGERVGAVRRFVEFVEHLSGGRGGV
jgi:hypothetical protein